MSEGVGEGEGKGKKRMYPWQGNSKVVGETGWDDNNNPPPDKLNISGGWKMRVNMTFSLYFTLNTKLPLKKSPRENKVVQRANQNSSPALQPTDEKTRQIGVERGVCFSNVVQLSM